MHMRRCLTLCVALGCTVVATSAVAQGLPASQPTILQIYREQIKVGHQAAHVVSEAAWPAAYAKSKSPVYYLALVSLTGRPEVWFMNPHESYTAWGRAMADDEGNPVLAAELAKASIADAAHIDGYNAVELRARTDLSYGAYPDIATQRFWTITTYRLRPGGGGKFDAFIKSRMEAAKRSMPNAAWRMYQVLAGERGAGAVFVMFSSVKAFGDLDGLWTESMEGFQTRTPGERVLAERYNEDAAMNVETNRYVLDPKMSYVSAEMRATDPAFWSRK
jgi:hypothetical protein